MSGPIARYLEKRTLLDRWPLRGDAPDQIAQAVVIPALAEYPGIFDTLADLNTAPPHVRAQTLVVVVVNNRPLPCASVETIANNMAAMERLRETPGVAYIDAASPGHELPANEGVGLARKLGMDAALSALHQRGCGNASLISLDADTRTEPHYLECIADFFAAPERWAAILDYAHPLDDSGAQRAAIIAYESYLRCHELALAWAGSPYAFCALGSAMACTARAYAAVSGMNRRLAGEDFYFLQQLAKTGRIDRITATTVHPAARISARTPFGTGPRMAQSKDQENSPCFVHHPRAYAVLRAWLLAAAERVNESASALMETASRIDPALAAFLEQDRFAAAWSALQKQHRNAPHFMRHFHTWFDGLRSIRLLHHLRDHGHPDLEIGVAVPEFAALGVFPPLRSLVAQHAALLQELRECCRRLPPAGVLPESQ